MEVRLSWMEVYTAAMTGVMRYVSSLKADRKDTIPTEGTWGTWNTNIEGTIAEIACAKALKMFWSPTVNTFKAPDIGEKIQVRHIDKETNSLIVRERDSDSEIYILVFGSRGVYKILGWISGKDAKQEKWKRDPHGYGVPSFFVPQSELKPIETIQGAV